MMGVIVSYRVIQLMLLGMNLIHHPPNQRMMLSHMKNKFREPDKSFIVTLRELARLKAARDEAFHAGQYAEAVEHYSAAIACSTESCFLTAVCLCNHAATYQALGHIFDVIADCSLAIALDPTYTKVFNLRLLISLLEKQQQENQAGRLSKTNIADDINQARRILLSAEELIFVQNMIVMRRNGIPRFQEDVSCFRNST